MTLLMFDFQCENEHTFEKLAPSHEYSTKCPECGEQAKRMISPVRLDWRMGVDSDMPTMASKWAKMHKQAAKTKD